MTSKLRTAALVLLGSAALEPRMAPAPQVQPAEPVICITNDLVQVDVVVTDSKGNRVTDLRPEDFEIQEDGKRQAITRFSFVGPPMQRTLVLVFDDSDSTGAIFEPVRSSLTHLVTQWVQPGDLVSVLRTGEGTGEWQQLTSDRQRLYQAIGRDNRAERLQVYGPPPQIQERAKLGGNALRWGDRQPLLVGVASLQALSSAVDGLAAMPGRKSLVLASALLGWTEFSEKTVAIRQLADRASRGGVVLHVLDLSETEVVNASLGASHRTSIQAARNDDVGKRPPNIAPAANRPWELRDSGADYLARATGGLSPSFKNDVRDSDRQQRTQRMLEAATA